MTVDEAREAEIRRLHFAEHWKVGTIAAQLGEHHDVVERVLGLGKAASPSPRSSMRRWSSRPPRCPRRCSPTRPSSPRP
jgi:hypothetical protein